MSTAHFTFIRLLVFNINWAFRACAGISLYQDQKYLKAVHILAHLTSIMVFD